MNLFSAIIPTLLGVFLLGPNSTGQSATNLSTDIPAGSEPAQIIREYHAGIKAEELDLDLDAALKHYQAAIASYEDYRSVGANALFRAASCLSQRGDLEGAGSLLRRLIHEFPTEFQLIGLARDYLQNPEVALEKKKEGIKNPADETNLRFRPLDLRNLKAKSRAELKRDQQKLLEKRTSILHERDRLEDTYKQVLEADSIALPNGVKTIPKYRAWQTSYRKLLTSSREFESLDLKKLSEEQRAALSEREGLKKSMIEWVRRDFLPDLTQELKAKRAAFEQLERSILTLQNEIHRRELTD